MVHPWRYRVGSQKTPWVGTFAQLHATGKVLCRHQLTGSKDLHMGKPKDYLPNSS